MGKLWRHSVIGLAAMVLLTLGAAAICGETDSSLVSSNQSAESASPPVKFLLASNLRFGDEGDEKVVVDADETEIDAKNNLIHARGNVVITRGKARATADRAEYNTQSKTAYLEGNVHLTHELGQWRGPRLTYNFITQSATFDEYRGAHKQWFAGGKTATKDGDHISISHGFVTTCEYDYPHYRLQAARIEVYPDNRIVARGVGLFVGNVPIFWVPYLRLLAGKAPPMMEINPGHRSRTGFYLLTTYRFDLTDSVSGAVHADYRTLRGPAGGLDLDYRLGEDSVGALKTYVVDDKRPKDADDDTDKIGHTRYRLSWAHRQPLTDNLAAMARINKLSDPDLLEDFFERDFRAEPQPDSFADVTYRAPTFTVSLLTRGQINNFYETTERLPEARFDAVRQPLFKTGFFYESESSASYMRRNFAVNSGSTDFDSVRLDTFHQLTYPQLVGGWLSVVPRVGGRLTYYEESSTADRSSALRGVFNTGMELGTKASRQFNVTSDAWDIHGLRHIIEPSLNYAYVPKPNKQPDEVFQFDTVRYTTRLLPLDFPQYRTIDSIDLTNTLRPGLRNRLQTRRKSGDIVDWVDWRIYGDYRIEKLSAASRFSDVYNEFHLRPWDWFYGGIFSRVDPNDGVLRELNTEVAFIGSTDWAVSLGTRFLQRDSHLLTAGLYARLTENWAVRVTQRVEAREGRWEEQEYTIERDLHCWTAALSVRHRDERVGPDDWRITLTFVLKALPGQRISLGN